MEFVTRVQITDKVVSALLNANDLGKGMNSTVPPSSEETVEQTGLFSLS